MYILDIEVTENRDVKLSTSLAGSSFENNVTLLNFIIPKDYSDYYKYLDIVKGDSEKTQTVLSTDDEINFSYRLPYELTDKLSLTLQLVMKKGESIFKSNAFKVAFNPSLCATQYLESEYKDTITYIMENKADNEQIDKLKEAMEAKLDKSSYYDHITLQDNVNNKKVDKVEGKELSSNDFTDTYKNKVIENEADINAFNAELRNIKNDVKELQENSIVVDNSLSSDSENPVQNKVVTERFEQVDGNINENTNMINVLTEEFRGYTSDYGERIQSNEDNIQINGTRVGDLERFIGDEYILNGYSLKQIIGDIHAALDELHNYSLALIGGDK